MGMYDEIRIEQVLPGNTEITDERYQTKSVENAEWYQTKSLENVLTKYVITANGELYEERWDCSWVSDEGHMLKGYLKRIEGSYRREYLTDYHGDINFYKGMDSNKVVRDYFARFTDGKLSKMWYEDTQY